MNVSSVCERHYTVRGATLTVCTNLPIWFCQTVMQLHSKRTERLLIVSDGAVTHDMPDVIVR